MSRRRRRLADNSQVVRPARLPSPSRPLSPARVVRCVVVMGRGAEALCCRPGSNAHIVADAASCEAEPSWLADYDKQRKRTALEERVAAEKAAEVALLKRLARVRAGRPPQVHRPKFKQVRGCRQRDPRSWATGADALAHRGVQFAGVGGHKPKAKAHAAVSLSDTPEVSFDGVSAAEADLIVDAYDSGNDQRVVSSDSERDGAAWKQKPTDGDLYVPKVRLRLSAVCLLLP